MTSSFSKLQQPKDEKLEDLFDNMQITVVGGNNEEQKSEISSQSDGVLEEDEYFKEDLNKIS